MHDDARELLALTIAAGAAIATVLLHGGQDLALGEPARLGVSESAFTLAFIAYGAAACAAMALAPRHPAALVASGALSGLAPLALASFHHDALSQGAYGAVLWLAAATGLVSLSIHGKLWDVNLSAR